ncbi:uncharacterized protein LOC114533540 [Dendronephthya gigantea]|uniref:uncharacterized protein LOC114533540 n=1 Tax=Dendronephthya gigantea TaxID=151771 RepID=UPI00106B2C89|nr:uncharacterized protein LOC114533540 [Dendronephthya gigantea]
MFSFIARRCGKTTPFVTRKTLYRIFSTNMTNKVEEIIEYWFGPGHVQWFGGGEAVDIEIREKYGDLVEAAFDGKLEAWKDEPRASLALIIVCDQFCRGVHKKTGKMTGLDPIALEVAHKFVEQKTHNHLDFSFHQRWFIYMPFEHSEDRANQELSVKFFTQLLADAKTPEEKKTGEMCLQYAKNHKEVIDRFGRYPQRNAKLGRENTPEEEEFLANLPSKYKW